MADGKMIYNTGEAATAFAESDETIFPIVSLPAPIVSKL
jgi:hypothetical protein